MQKCHKMQGTYNDDFAFKCLLPECGRVFHAKQKRAFIGNEHDDKIHRFPAVFFEMPGIIFADKFLNVRAQTFFMALQGVGRIRLF